MKPPKSTGQTPSPFYRPAPELPTLKKKEEEKKGGGVPLIGGASSSGGVSKSGGFFARLFGLGRGGGGSLARGGAATVGRSVGMGAAGKLGFGPMLVNFLASNLGALILTGLVTGGAVYTLYSLGMNAIADKPAKSSVFPQLANAVSGEAGEARVDASGLSYFQTANQGGAFADPAQAAAKDAPAGDKAAEAPAEEPKVPEPAEPPSGPQIADALAKQFEKPKMIAAGGRSGGLGIGNGLAGGAGLAGGMNKKFDLKADDMKKTTQAMRRDPAAKLTARRMSPIRGAKGGAKDQLRFANSLSRKALGNTSSEGQSFTAAEAFNTAPAAQGARDLSKGVGDGAKGIDPSPSDSDGGPLSTRTGEEPAPGTGQKEDKSPYTKALMAAMALLMTASTIILIIGILAIIKKMPIIGVIAEMWQKILYGAAIAMASAASGIGAMVAQDHGQKDQGLMVTIGGAITAASATAALAMPGPQSAWVAVLGGIAGIGASIGALLLPQMQGGGGGGGSAARGTK